MPGCLFCGSKATAIEDMGPGSERTWCDEHRPVDSIDIWDYLEREWGPIATDPEPARDPRFVKALEELDRIVERNPHLAWGAPARPVQSPFVQRAIARLLPSKELAR